MAKPKSLPQTKMQKMPRSKKKALYQCLEDNFALLVEHTDVDSPLTFLTQCYSDPELPMGMRIDAAKTVAGYVHKKAAQEIEVESNHTVNITVAQQQAITQLDDYLFNVPMRALKHESAENNTDDDDLDIVDAELVDESVVPDSNG